MPKAKPVRAWAAKIANPRTGAAFLNERAVRARRVDVHISVGRVLDMDWRVGWKLAYRRGWRVVPVEITEVG